MPLVRSLPKFGFTNKRFQKKYAIINLSDLNRFDSEVHPEILYKEGLAKQGLRIKILGKGDLSKPLKVKAHYFSQGAISAIEKAGGEIKKIDLH